MPFWRIVPPLPHPYWAQSVAPAGWQGRVPRQSRPPLPSRRGCRPHPSRAPSPQGAGSQPKGLQSTNALPIIAPCNLPSCSGAPRQEQWRTMPPMPLPARPPPQRGGFFEGANNKCPAAYSSLQIPPLPHPYWAQSVAPAGWQGRVPRQSRPPLPSRRGCRPHPSRAPSPQGAGSQPKGLQSTNALPIIAPCNLPSCSGAPRQEQWRTEPPLPLPARPPPLKGWISFLYKRKI